MLSAVLRLKKQFLENISTNDKFSHSEAHPGLTHSDQHQAGEGEHEPNKTNPQWKTGDRFIFLNTNISFLTDVNYSCNTFTTNFKYK